MSKGMSKKRRGKQAKVSRRKEINKRTDTKMV